MTYQPKTGECCACHPGDERDNCSWCEGTGMKIDFAAIRARAALTKEQYEAEQVADRQEHLKVTK